MFSPLVLLSTVAFLPAAGALVLLLFSRIVFRSDSAIRMFTLLVTIATLAASLYLAAPKPEGATDARFAIGQAGMQNMFAEDWIPSLNIQYAMGIDGISLPLIVLTALVGVLAMGASWTIDRHVKAYCILFLLLQTGILGVFLALDLFLFYIFWEVMLLPMYFLIGVWGGPRRLYAAIKFFLFTLTGGVLMLIAILMLYFASDLRTLSTEQLARAGAVDAGLPAAEQQQAAAALRQKIEAGELTRHTFNILALQQMGQHTALFDTEVFLGKSTGWWAFVLLFIGFIIKVPSVPFHTWLPDAHVEAPTPISMILAGILLKLGGYGILRLCYPVYPAAGEDLQYVVCGLGLVSMVYGALAAMAATDFKRLVAYSSVSHMGYVLLGIGAWQAAGSWSWGINGAMFQMIAHGISSAGMFFIVGVIYDRVHHRNLDQFGGIFSKMPVYGGLAFGIFFAGLGLPGLCGFIGEVLVVFAAWQYSKTLALIAAAVVLLTAGYILWALQRVYLGSEYKGPHAEGISPITPREVAIAAPILTFAIVLGVYPQPVLRYVAPSVDQMVEELHQADLRPGVATTIAERERSAVE